MFDSQLLLRNTDTFKLRNVGLTLFITCLSVVALLDIRAYACPDLSGHYRPYYETDEDDVVTTVDFTQHGCDSVLIGGMANGKPHFEFETKVYGLQHLSLKGDPAPTGLNCLWNSFPGVCASYLATDSSVVKTAAQPAAAADQKHGTCFYTVSNLTKDRDGNLVETPQASNCDDGFKGTLAPFVWSKAN